MRSYLFEVITSELHILKISEDYDSLVNKSVQEIVDEGVIGNSMTGLKGTLYT